LLELREEPEGRGLDYLISRLGGEPIAIRWGLSKGGRIRRNGTERSTEFQSQGVLFPELNSETLADGLPLVTIAFTIEDGYTE
jgi:hypothetical protein